MSNSICSPLRCRSSRRLVLGLFNDRFDQGIPVLLDHPGFGFIGFPLDRLPTAIVGDAATQQVDRTDDVAVLDQRYAERLHIAEDPSASRDGFLVVGAGLLELGHRDRPRHVRRLALAPQHPSGIVDLVAGRDHEQHRVGGAQSGAHLADEVGVAGCVEEIDHDIAAGDGGGSECLRRRRLAAYMPSRRTRRDQTLEQRALAGACRPDEHHVADQFRRLRTVLRPNRLRCPCLTLSSTPLRKLTPMESQSASPNSPRARSSNPTMQP